MLTAKFLFKVSTTISREFHLSSNPNIYSKIVQITNKSREAESLKLSEISDEVFQVSDDKLKEINVTVVDSSSPVMKQIIFEEAILTYLQRYGKTRRGHVEFIKASLKRMKDYEVQRNIDIYKKIFAIFPEVKMIPKTFWQTEMYHYPKQQDCALVVLSAMEENGVIPDEDFGRMIYRRFGLHTSPMARYERMVYWLPKFKNLNPWPLPHNIPEDPIELSKLALGRMNPARETKITKHEIKINEFEKTWILSAQSHIQKNLINYLSKSSSSVASSPLTDDKQERVAYIDGPYSIWVRNQQLNYYLLTSELDEDRLAFNNQLHENQQNTDKVFYDNWYTIFDPNTRIPIYYGESENEKALPRELTKYEDNLESRSILASCITGNESLSSLRTWLNIVIKENPALKNFKFVFRLQSSPNEITVK